MRYLLWKVAQHKYGWTYVSRHRGGLQIADALLARGLVCYGASGRDTHPSIEATTAGRAEIERRWPISPFALGTYEDQPGGWQQPDGTQPFSESAGVAV
jgi:hypothetical protein